MTPVSGRLLRCLAAQLMITSRVMMDSVDVGQALKVLRVRAGLTQREFAERLGVQQPAIARWEAGRVRIPISRIEEIVGELGYGLEYDLTAIPIDEAVNNGVPVTLVSRRL